MSIPASLLLVAAFVQLLRSLTGDGAARRLDPLVWLGNLGLIVWQLRHDGVLISIVPVYLVLAIAIVSAAFRSARRRRNATVGRRRVWPRVALTIATLPLATVPVIEATVFPFEVDDFSDETWTTAFDRLHATLQSHYAFGDWKRIDWSALHTRHASAVGAAERAEDPEGYYRAVRTYLHELSDGHVGIDSPSHEAVRFADIGGGFGLAVRRLHDGTVIATFVEAGGPAADAGMVWGAQILEWDDSPIDAALSATPTLWSSRPPATIHTTSIAQQQLLTRSPVGAKRFVTFRNPGSSLRRGAVLTAEDDRYSSLDEAGGNATSDSEPPVRHELLDDGIGYLRIASLANDPAHASPLDTVEQAMREMENAPALIVDARGNRGGRDDLVPAMMSYFTPDRLLYEHIVRRAPIGGGVLRLFSLHVEPNDLQFSGPVVVLVDHRTKSSGEGFALLAKQLSNVSVIGLERTDGSFGITGGSVLLPTGIEVKYPWAQSVDADGTIQVDGDHLGRGGIEPDVVVPLTFETAEAIHRRGDDVVFDVARRWLLARL